MPAPPSGLLAASRKGSASRHSFFYMDHSQGPIYAWDGVGTFTYGGNDYLGVAGYVQIDGVSDSGDIQNHDIYVMLNGAGIGQFANAGIRQACVNIGPALATVDLNIRGRAATLTLLWLAEDGSIVSSLIILKGKGDIVKINGLGDTFAIKARIAPPIAAWDSPPRAYYTREDQAGRFAGDTGFDFVSDLQSATVNGWSNVAPVGGGDVVMFAPSNPWPRNHPLASALTGALFGDDSWGMVLCGLDATWNSHVIVFINSSIYEEENTAVKPVGGGSKGANILLSGNPVTIDGSGVIRTAAGNRLVGPSQDLTRFLRQQSSIASNGTASAETITGSGSSLVRASGATTPQGLNSRLVYDNQNGPNVFVNSGVPQLRKSNGSDVWVNYVEDVTGAAVSFSTTLKVGGSNCVLSSTGVILSPLGHRIIPSGGNPAKEFLRIWI